MKRLGLILLLCSVLITGCSEEKGKPTYKENRRTLLCCL